MYTRKNREDSYMKMVKVERFSEVTFKVKMNDLQILKYIMFVIHT